MAVISNHGQSGTSPNRIGILTTPAENGSSLGGSSLNHLASMIFSKNPEAVDYLKKEPGLAPLKEIIDFASRCGLANFRFCEIRTVLMVLFGIKPAYAMEPENEFPIRGDVVSVIRKIVPLNPNCRLIDSADAEQPCYFVNEAPLAVFDPRQYIQKELFDRYGGKIAEAIQKNFYLRKKDSDHVRSIREEKEETQFCSYLLGYGPCWEAFERPRTYEEVFRFNASHPDALHRIFSEKHYEELGVALHSDAQKGRSYSLAALRIRQYPENPLMAKLRDYLGAYFVFDEVSINTPYMKRLFYHLHQLMQFLAEYSSNQSLCPDSAVRSWLLAYLH